ncbi:MAG: Nudix family hydrolase [Burkholderiales bacterium]
MKAEGGRKKDQSQGAESKDQALVHPSSFIPHPCIVAAAVILRADGAFLFARRPEGKPYAGYWEFPGGKLLPGETALDALKRELKEELDLTIDEAWPWLTREYVYPHASVRLHFFRVFRWRGNAQGLEGQAVAWQRAGEISIAPMLPANAPVLRALALPPVYAITSANEIGVDRYLERLKGAFEAGIKMIQVREKEMPLAKFRDFTRRVIDMASSHGAKVLLNSAHLSEAESTGAHGIHLTAKNLIQRKARPESELCAASCHNAAELERAVALELDFVVLGPVRATQSHQEWTPLGWLDFSRLISAYPLPVYAIGGMRRDDIERACSHGAHGVAMIRGLIQG